MTERYDVQLSNQAAKTLRKLDRAAQQRVLRALSLLQDHPRPPAATQLVGHPGYLRIRTGDYRIVYTINKNELVVLVLEVGHRREIYASLE